MHLRGRRLRTAWRLAAWSLGGLLVLYLLALPALYVLMRQPPQVVGKGMARVPGPLFAVLPMEWLWSRAREGALRVGDPAPDFSLPTLDRSETVSLSRFRGDRPVALVFGSYT